MSSGRDSTTGPGRPAIATWKARWMYSGMRSASAISADHLASGANIAGKSTSWKPSRSRMRRATCPMNSTIGVESWKAVCTPVDALVAPGPRVTKHTPGRLVSFP